jgi:putative ABC transport system permease protein
MQIQESMVMALNAIKVNKLRSTLTLLGIGVGVFSIICVMTAMGVLQNAIESGLSQLGTDTFQIQKFPAMSFGDSRRMFRNRKDITFEQGLEFVRRMKSAKYIGLEVNFSAKEVASDYEKTNPNVELDGETVEGFPTNDWTIGQGRAFTNEEVQDDQNVCVLGPKVADRVFPHSSPLGQDIRIDGNRFRVIGIMAPKGSFLGGDEDNFAVIPITTAMDIYGKQRSIHIMVEAKSRDTYDETIELSREILRTIRRVDPGADDDFAIFSNDTMIQQFNSFTFLIKIGTVGIACIALIAAGVGIMNIMLVSVTERTKEIGIRKALGATKTNILTQFLSESVVFSQIGGIVGIITGSMIGNVLSLIMKAPPIMPWNTTVAILETPLLNFTALEMNIVALLFCSFIGIVFGVYPAWKAANLDPIESLRYE